MTLHLTGHHFKVIRNTFFFYLRHFNILNRNIVINTSYVFINVMIQIGFDVVNTMHLWRIFNSHFILNLVDDIKLFAT